MTYFDHEVPPLFQQSDKGRLEARPTTAKRSLPRSRRSDPSTSKEAARKVQASGTVEAHRERILAAMRKIGPATAAELAVQLTPCTDGLKAIDQVEVSRRLPEMERDGLVVRNGRRKCRVKGSSMTIWQPTE